MMIARRVNLPSFFRGSLFWIMTFFLLIIVFCINQMKNPVLFPVRHVKVVGAQHVDHQQLQQLLLPSMRHGFFGLKLTQIRNRILQFPWVFDVSVVRSWPDVVLIQVIERHAVALWNETQLLSAKGEIFTPNKKSFPVGLPHFIAPEGKALTVLQQYHLLSQLVAPLKVHILSLELTPWHSWLIVLQNGIRIHVGYKDILTRINHFVKVYPSIIGAKAEKVDYVDLQYPDGFAVRWKTIS